MADPPLLAVRGLSVTFRTPRGVVRVVDDVSFDVGAGRMVALVGESGSGKSVTAFSILRLHDATATLTGAVVLDGVDLLGLHESALRRLRGRRVAMIFQDPLSSLNRVRRVGDVIGDALRWHEGLSGAALQARVVELLGKVGLPPERARSYPHELSGGMRQRVMIAAALAGRPEVLIADEPTTALDATIQAQIVDLLLRLTKQEGLALLFITHDLGLVASCADDVVVLYAGQVVESGAVADVFAAPRHPYTAGLLACAPRLGRTGGRLPEIPGVVPDLARLPSGCRFADRCVHVDDACRAATPALVDDVIGLSRRRLRCLHPRPASPSSPGVSSASSSTVTTPEAL
jgi:oligopeptide/dipeptide ABC transporter ATP-binding protein